MHLAFKVMSSPIMISEWKETLYMFMEEFLGISHLKLSHLSTQGQAH